MKFSENKFQCGLESFNFASKPPQLAGTNLWFRWTELWSAVGITALAQDLDFSQDANSSEKGTGFMPFLFRCHRT